MHEGASWTPLAFQENAAGRRNCGVSVFDLSWMSQDEGAGVKSVTVYVAENGGDFKIWLRQASPETTQAIFTINGKIKRRKYSRLKETL
ncbi:MAG: hypothetical protein LBU23_13360, partial [Planctomycetota bacterium]|nr:hypothetical protein [Planctomycetota bacterium]